MLLLLNLPVSVIRDQLACLPDKQAGCRGKCITGGRAHGCIDPPPVPGQCSFPRARAAHLCGLWQKCAAVNCHKSNLHCQARGHAYTLAHSFGDVEVFVPVPAPDKQNQSSALLQGAHIQGSLFQGAACHGRLRRDTSVAYAGSVQVLNCSSANSGMCTLTSAPPLVVQHAEKRLRQLTHERKRLLEVDAQLLFTPVATADPLVAPEVPEDLFSEQLAYERAHAKHYFLADSQYIYRTFFKSKRKGFFIEAGGLNGASDGSNSLFFERYLHWRGLMVEASPLNFALLYTRRPLAYRLEAALASEQQILRFSGHGCCGKINSAGDGYQVHAMPIGPILQAMGIKRVDFWSLDVSLH